MEILQAIFSNTIIAFILLIGVVVFVHELGHFIAGKIFGIQVEEFSIGFGPKAFSFKKGTTEYRINWLPLGGYVRFYGADIEENVPLEFREKSILHAKVYKRAIVSFAGPLANFILSFFILIGISIYGIPQQLPIISVLPNSVAEKSGLETGDRILSIDGKNIGNWSQLTSVITKYPEEKLEVVVERNGIKKNIKVTPKKEEVETIFGNRQAVGRVGVMNTFNSSHIVVTKGGLFESIGLKSGDKILSINGKNTEYLFEVVQVLEKVTESSSDFSFANKIKSNFYRDLQFEVKIQAERKDLKNKNEKNIISFDFSNEKMKTWANKYLSHKPMKNLLWKKELLSSDQTIDQYSDLVKGSKQVSSQEYWKKCGLMSGDTLYSVEGLGRIFSLSQFGNWLDATSKAASLNVNKTKNTIINMSVIKANGSLASLSCQIPLREGFDHLNREQLFLDFPVSFVSQNVSLKPIIMKAQTFSEALNKGFASLINQMTLIFTGIKMLLTGSIPLSNLGGPIAIAGVAGDAAKGGLMTFLFTMAFISINVGMMNLLPFPALDGGALLLHAVEAAYGKPLPKTVQLAVQRAGVLILLGLFVLVFYNDILRLIRF